MFVPPSLYLSFCPYQCDQIWRYFDTSGKISKDNDNFCKDLFVHSLPTLAKILWYWANFHCYKWPKIKQYSCNLVTLVPTNVLFYCPYLNLLYCIFKLLLPLYPRPISLSSNIFSLSLSLSLSPLPHTLTFKASVCLCMPLCPFLLTIHFDHLSTCHKTLTVYQVCILLLPWPSFSSDYLSFYPSVISSYLRNPTLQSIVFFYLLVPTTRRTDSAINFFLLEFILSQPIYRPLFLSYL